MSEDAEFEYSYDRLDLITKEENDECLDVLRGEIMSGKLPEDTRPILYTFLTECLASKRHPDDSHDITFEQKPLQISISFWMSDYFKQDSFIYLLDYFKKSNLIKDYTTTDDGYEIDVTLPNELKWYLLGHLLTTPSDPSTIGQKAYPVPLNKQAEKIGQLLKNNYLELGITENSLNDSNPRLQYFIHNVLHLQKLEVDWVNVIKKLEADGIITVKNITVAHEYPFYLSFLSSAVTYLEIGGPINNSVNSNYQSALSFDNKILFLKVGSLKLHKGGTPFNIIATLRHNNWKPVSDVIFINSEGDFAEDLKAEKNFDETIRRFNERVKAITRLEDRPLIVHEDNTVRIDLDLLRC